MVIITAVPTAAMNNQILTEWTRRHGNGERVTRLLGQSIARRQVLGPAGMAPQPAPRIAREMGLARQVVQRFVNVLMNDGLVMLSAIPGDKRTSRVALTGYVVWPESPDFLGTRRATKVLAKVGKHEFSVTCLPVGDGTHVVPLSKSVMSSIGKDGRRRGSDFHCLQSRCKYRVTPDNQGLIMHRG